MINLIPMAGLGTRFSDAGYKLSKPLIGVSGVPMIIKVIRDLPKADKWIFVIRKEHQDYGVDRIIKQELPKALIIILDYNTEGQASTCLTAAKYLDSDEELLIAPCDSGFLYDENRFNELKSRDDVDSIIWTFTQRETLLRNPKAWGWYGLEEDNETIKDISVKVPVSEDPYNDHAVVAVFYFKKARDFIDSANLMITQNYRINNEFYVDAIPRFMKTLGKRSIIFDVDLYVGFGKPDDLHDYELMEFIVRNGITPKNMTEEEKNLLPLWKKYFANGKN